MAVRPVPRAVEARFEADELFFSRTDPRGIILAGNDVFVRVSGYRRDELLGHPHNVIRHPDMPKAVFKLFWDVLHSNRMVVAYVKNMAQDGSYYWVLACALPVDGGYLSIRLKPSSELFSAAKKIYAEVLEHEKKAGVEAAGALLMEKLRQAGFPDYDAFMRKVLSTELEARDQAIPPATIDASRPAYYQSCEAAAAGFKAIFDRIVEASRRSAKFRSDSKQVLGVYKNIKFLSLNMTVESEHLGAAGRTLAVASSTFATWAEEIQRAVTAFDQSLRGVMGTLEALDYSVAAARCQVEMAAFFMREYFVKSEADRRASFGALLEDSSYFFAAPERVFADVRARLLESETFLKSFLGTVDALRGALNALTLIRLNAKMEIARLPEGSHSFLTHLEEMQNLISEVQTSTARMNQEVFSLHQSFQDIEGRIKRVEKDFRDASRIE